MKRILICLLAASVALAISPQDQAKLNIGEITKLWIDGEYDQAMDLIQKTLQQPIDPFDLPKIYYLKAKVEIDTLKISEALKDVRSMLAVSLGTPEVVSLLKELEFFTGERNFKRNLRMERIREIDGIVDGTEYFYTITDLMIRGERVYGVDRVNSRLLVYEKGRLLKAFSLPFHPLSMSFSPSGLLFLSSTDGGIYVFSNGVTTEVATGLRSPILAGFDRSGVLWGIDGERIFKYDGSLKVYDSNLTFAGVDCEVYGSSIWILDALKRRVIVLSKSDISLVRDIPLPVETRAFEITPMGDLILLSTTGKIYFYRKGKELVEIGLTLPGVMAFEYVHPFLLMGDWINRKIYVDILTDGEPFFVRVVDLKSKPGRVEVWFRAEGISGDDLNMLREFLVVSLDGGGVNFSLEREEYDVGSYKSSKDFLTDKLPILKERKGLKVLIPPDSYVENGVLATLRSKGVRIFVEGEPEGELERIMRLSGGEVSQDIPPRSKRFIWKLTLRYVPDTNIKVHTISVGVRIFGELFSDTIYVVDRGVSGE